MKKFKLKSFLNVIIAVFCVLTFAFLLMSSLTESMDFARVIAYSVLGCLITLFANIFLHEIFHLIFGAFAGLKFSELQLFFLNLKKKGKKIKFKFKGADGVFGYSLMATDNPDGAMKKYVVSSFGGLLISFLIIVSQVVVSLSVKDLFLVVAIGNTLPISVYIFLINLLPVFENNDGSLIYLYAMGGEKKATCENYFKAVALLNSGVEPSNLDSKYLIKSDADFTYGAKIAYLRYLAYITSDEEEAFKELYSLSDLSKHQDMYDEIFEEMFFSAILMDDKKFIKNNENYAIKIFENPIRPQTFRVHASYRVYTEELDWAKLIVDSGISFCEDYEVKGIAKAEKSYLELIKSKI